MQLKLPIIPKYKNSRIYIVFNFKNKRFIDTGRRKLVFYKTENSSEHTGKNEVMSLEFPDFKTVYKFILDNEIKNFNIENDCCTKEIRQYKKESSHGYN